MLFVIECTGVLTPGAIIVGVLPLLRSKYLTGPGSLEQSKYLTGHILLCRQQSSVQVMRSLPLHAIIVDRWSPCLARCKEAAVVRTFLGGA